MSQYEVTNLRHVLLDPKGKPVKRKWKAGKKHYDVRLLSMAVETDKKTEKATMVATSQLVETRPPPPPPEERDTNDT